jgi:hypothetical protein
MIAMEKIPFYSMCCITISRIAYYSTRVGGMQCIHSLQAIWPLYSVSEPGQNALFVHLSLLQYCLTLVAITNVHILLLLLRRYWSVGVYW